LFIQNISLGHHGVEDGRIQPTAKSRPARVVDPRHPASPSPCPSSFIMTPVAPSSTGASTHVLSATPIPCASSILYFLGIGVRLTNFIIICSQGEDARFMSMQVLLEQSSTSTEVLKDQMDRTREKHSDSPLAVATQNCLTKTRPKQRARQSPRRASRRGKRTPAWRVTTSVTPTPSQVVHMGAGDALTCRPNLPCLGGRP